VEASDFAPEYLLLVGCQLNTTEGLPGEASDENKRASGKQAELLLICVLGDLGKILLVISSSGAPLHLLAHYCLGFAPAESLLSPELPVERRA
jgi:hypothetical protein